MRRNSFCSIARSWYSLGCLRKQIARLSFNWGGSLSDDDIVVTAGCMEALSFCLKAVTKPGDAVATESPTFYGIFRVMQSLGLKVVEVPTDPVTGIDIDYLEQAIPRFNIKACLFVCNFNNPLGNIIPDDKKYEVRSEIDFLVPRSRRMFGKFLLAMLIAAGVASAAENFSGSRSKSE